MSSHPRLRTRGTPGYVATGEVTRALCYIPDVFHRTWIERELAQLHINVQIERTVGQLVAAMIDDPPPRPQLLFADVDSMTAGELLHLHDVRMHGWFGTMFAVGDTTLPLQHSLGIERVLTPPLSRSQLRAALLGMSHAQTTTKMSRISG
jgi:hypothetical protein